MLKLIASVALLAVATSAQAVSVYQIGNSLTWDSRPSYLDEYAENLNLDWTGGWHIRTGSTLTDILNDPNPAEPQHKLAFPFPYGDSLPGAWDKLVVQSYRGAGHTLAMDIAAVQAFSDMAPDAELYIYGSWPQTFAWGDWLLPVSSDGSQLTVPRRAYFETLIDQLDRPAKLVPVGDVLFRIKTEIDAGNLPLFSSIADFYRDDKHMSAWGKFFAATTVLTVMSGQNIGVGEYDETLDPDGMAAIQRIIWDVVANHPLTGVETLPGDYDGNGVVDAADLAWWGGSFGHDISFASDGNGDGKVNIADYAIWRDSIASPPESSHAVPEPASILIAAIVFLSPLPRYKVAAG